MLLLMVMLAMSGLTKCQCMCIIEFFLLLSRRYALKILSGPLQFGLCSLNLEEGLELGIQTLLGRSFSLTDPKMLLVVSMCICGRTIGNTKVGMDGWRSAEVSCMHFFSGLLGGDGPLGWP
jgi:hypothetical protein